MISHASKRKLSQRSVINSNQQNMVYGGDPYWTAVSFASHGDSGSLDLTGKSLTANGNATVSTAQAKFGSNAWYFDGAGDYFNAGGQSDFAFGTGDFTIEFWVYLNTLANQHSLIDFRALTTSAVCFTSYVAITTGQLIVNNDAGGNTISGPNLAANRWYHIAVARQNGMNRLFVDGVLSGSVADTATHVVGASAPVFGTNGYYRNNYFLNGYLDDIRITKGVARYTTNFVPPQQTFDHYPATYAPTNGDPYWSAVSFASHGDSVTADLTGKSVTAYGNAAVSTTQSKFGGSAWYFDGTGDYVDTPVVNSLKFDADNFTIEGWFLRGSTGSIHVLFGHMTAAGTEHLTLRFDVGNTLTAYFKHSGGPINTTSTATVTDTTTWHHLAYVRNGADGAVYLDGVRIITQSLSTYSVSDSATKFAVGRGGEYAGQYFNGYVDDFRVTKGVARYTGNFVPPVQAFDHYQAPVTPVDGDPYYDNVVFHSHFETLTDQKGHAITAAGNAAVALTQPKFGSKSLYCDGTGDYIDLGTNSDYDFGTGNFTIEFWVYHNQLKNYSGFIGAKVGTTSGSNIAIYSFSDGHAGVTFDGVGEDAASAAGVFSTGIWQHVALVRNGNAFTLYVDGVSKATGTTSNASTLYGNLGAVVGSVNSVGDLNGYIDELRITKGVARYTYNFVPPNAAFYDYKPTVIQSDADPYYSTNVVFLNDGSDLKDKLGHLFITYGNTTVSSSQSKFGGTSMYFDGTGDYLRSGQLADFALDTTFTVEAWLHPTASAASKSVFDFRDSNIVGSIGTDASGRFVGQVNATGTTVNSVTSIPQNQWTHVAFVSSASLAKTFVFINGVKESEYAAASTYGNTTRQLTIGADFSGTSAFQGYIDDIRITKGIARYTSNFNVPAAPHYSEPLPQPNRGGEDPYYGNVSLLMHFDGENNSKRIFDEKQHAVTLAGDTKLSTTYSKFGGSAAYFDGTGDYAYLDGSSDFAFGTGDFTIEGWFRTNAVGAQQTIYEGRPGSNGSYPYLYINTDGTLNFLWSSANRITAPAVAANTWVHFALTRASGVFRLFMGGIPSSGSYTDASSISISAGYPRIGADFGGTTAFNGYLDEVRITKGVARYTAPFRVPDSPFYSPSIPSADTPAGGDPYYSNVVFHSHFETLTDQKGNSITAYGNAAVSTGLPKFGSKALYCDGTGDYTESPASVVDFGTGDFTIEFWMYPQTTGAYKTAIQVYATPTLVFSTNSSNGLTLEYPTQVDITSITITNKWTHVAYCKRGTSQYLFADGILVHTGTAPSSITVDGNSRLFVGKKNGAGQDFNGYIDELRITKGIARYTSNFNPATAAYLDYSPATANDPYYDVGTKLLLHFDGVDNGTTFIDSKGHTITAAGNACTKIAQSKFGVSSLYLDGTGDYVTVAQSADFAFGTGDFTIEFWAWKSTSGNYDGVITTGSDGSSTGGWTIEFGNTRGMFLFGGVDVSILAYATSPNDSTWHHWAFTRSGTTVRLFKDGTQVASATSSHAFLANNALKIGLYGTSSYYNGYIDDLRITKGYARYTANFTPHTQSHPG